MNPKIFTHVAFYLDTHNPNKEGKFSLRIKVTHNRKRNYVKTGLFLSQEEYDEVMKDKPKGDFKVIRKSLDDILTHAKKIVMDMDRFEAETFKKLFYGKEDNDSPTNIFTYLENEIQMLKSEGRISTANSFTCSLQALKKFTGKDKLLFDEITPKLLNDFEKYFINKGRSITTVGIYLKNIRKLFNKASSSNLISKELYPFGRNKYQIPASNNIKKALSRDEIHKLLSYQPLQTSLWENIALDFYVFSYLCSGMNPKDILKLKWQDIDLQNGDIIFVRSKTASTSKKNLKPVTVYLEGTPLDKIKSIIEKYGEKSQNPKDFVFPYLAQVKTPERERATVNQFVKQCNKYLKRIAKNLNIDKKITTYTARHSFATMLKNSNVSVEAISEMLGHKDIKTTESYLNSFEKDTKRKASNLLMDLDKI
jgi:integrase